MAMAMAQVGLAVLHPGHHEPSIGRGPFPRRQRRRGARGGLGAAGAGAAGTGATGVQCQVAETGQRKTEKTMEKAMDKYGHTRNNQWTNGKL